MHQPNRSSRNSKDKDDWGNTSLSALVGFTTPLWCFLSPDAGAHMAEELKDASILISWAQVRPGWDIPVNSPIVVLVESVLISALNFGSDAAVNAIISLSPALLHRFHRGPSTGAFAQRRAATSPLVVGQMRFCGQ
ncbi:MAG: hypothetical protein Q9175_007227 [Cornicularia normoerica]